MEEMGRIWGASVASTPVVDVVICFDEACAVRMIQTRYSAVPRLCAVAVGAAQPWVQLFDVAFHASCPASRALYKVVTDKS
jgi:hypothetical protein